MLICWNLSTVEEVPFTVCCKLCHSKGSNKTPTQHSNSSLSTNVALCLVDVNWFGNCCDSFLWKQKATAFLV